jgi:transposase
LVCSLAHLNELIHGIWHSGQARKNHSRLKPMRDFAWMLRRHKDNILTYFQLKITNGIVEGLNNKAKVVSHRSDGFRTPST